MCSNDFAPDYPNMLIGTITFKVLRLFLTCSTYVFSEKMNFSHI